MKWKLSTAKRPKPQHFHEFFTKKKVEHFLRKSKLNFWSKNEDFEPCERLRDYGRFFPGLSTFDLTSNSWFDCSSVKSYSEALKLQPQFEAARSRRYAVLCHHKLEQALEEQHRSLEKTLNELRQYKKQHDEWSVLLNKILAEQATLETRMESRMSYEDFKMRLSKTGKGQNCFQHTKSGKTFVTCSLLQDNDVHKDLLEAPEEKDINTENIETWLRRFGGFDSTIEAEIGNVQLWFTSWQFCQLDGVLIITPKKANFT